MFSWVLLFIGFLGNIQSVGGDCDTSVTYTMTHDYEYYDTSSQRLDESDICMEHYYCTPDGDFFCGYGYYGTSKDSTDVSGCEVCPALRYCNKGNIACETGYICATLSLPREPAAGFYSINNRLNGCPPGFYHRHIQHIQWHSRGIKTCAKCPKFMFCDMWRQAMITGYCEDGHSCGSQQKTAAPKKCVAGQYCVRGQSFDCPEGFHQPYEERFDCFECPEGKYCSGVGLSLPSGDCADGWHCGRGETDSQPRKCGTGNMCPTGVLSPCGKGYYQPLDDQTTCIPCPAGKYCQDIGLSEPSGDCDPGCCLETTQISPTSCPPVSPSACLAGTYFDTNACVTCPVGMYCAIDGLSSPSGTCEPGWYCEEGEITPTPIGKFCPAGYQCATGIKVLCSSWVRNVEPYDGHVQYMYQPERGQTACIPCPDRFNCTEEGIAIAEKVCDPGKWCFFGLILDCEIGHYCFLGQMLPCRNGFKSISTNLEECSRCGDGKYCVNGQELPCPANMICYKGIVEFCDLHTVCTNGKTKTKCAPGFERYDQSTSTCVECRDHRYCVQGGSYECFRNNKGILCSGSENRDYPHANLSPPGTHYELVYEWQDTNRGYVAKSCEPGTYQSKSHQPSCDICPGGQYCTAGRQEPNGFCNQGYYCPRGSVSPTEEECPSGSYCESGSEVPIHCPVGTYQPNTGQWTCLPCPDGHYCDTPHLSVPPVCPAGSMCPGGSVNHTVCPESTFQSATTQVSCLQCTIGHYCPTTGLTAPVVCPAGSKCNTSGSASHTVCPESTFQPETTQVSCLQCTIGHYCPTTGLTAPVSCPAGSKCNTSGSEAPIHCPVGTYQQNTGQSTCLPCLEGHYCDTLNLSVPPDCPVGSMCPEGREDPIHCPVGTYQPNTGQWTCLPCLEGHYCDTLNLSVPPDCPAGSMCPEGSEVPIHCPAGSMCPEGMSVPIPCPHGYYQAETGKSACNVCPVHFYCNQTEAEAEKESGVDKPTYGVVTPKACPPKMCLLPGMSQAYCDMDPFRDGEAEISINCIPSCKSRMTSLKDLKFEANCAGSENEVSMYQWSLRECFNYDIQECVHCIDFVNFLTQPARAYIKIPHTDKQNWTYVAVVVKVTLKDGTKGMASHIWQYFNDIQVECQVSPVTGLAMLTHFNISCSEPELTADVSYICSMHYIYTLFGDSVIYKETKTCNHTGVVLQHGDETLYYRQDLHVVGKYFDHLLWDVPIIVQVDVPSMTIEAMWIEVYRISDKLAESNTSESTVEILSELQAGMDMLDEVTRLNYDVDSAENDEAVVNEKKKIREFLVSMMTEMDSSNTEVFVATTTMLNQNTLKKEELSTTAKDQMFETYNTLTETFLEKGENISSEDVTKTAETLLFGLGHVLDISSDDYLKEDEEEDETGEEEEGEEETSNESAPISVAEKQEIKKKKAKENTEQLLKSVKAVSEIVAKKQGIDGEQAVLETPMFSVAVAKVSKSNLGGMSIKTGKDGEDSATSVTLPEDLSLSDNVSSVRMEYLLIRKNPYVWGEGSKNVRPPVVSLEMKDQDDAVLNISSLPTPIKVTLVHDGGDMSGMLHVLCTFTKINGSIAIDPSLGRQCASTFEITMEREKITAFSLSLPGNFTALLSIGVNTKFNNSQVRGSGFRYPDDIDIIRQFYAKLSENEAELFDDEYQYCTSCYDMCCNTSKICTGIYEHCIYYCKSVIRNSVMESCNETFDATVYCVDCKNQCCNETVNCTGGFENCIFFCSLYMEENITATCGNQSSGFNYTALQNNTLISYCEDCDKFCCDGLAECSGLYSNCVFFCSNVISEKNTFCEKNRTSVETIFLHSKESRIFENETSYKMYFGLSVDPSDTQVLEYFSQLDPNCIGNLSLNACSFDIDMDFPLKASIMVCKYWDYTSEAWSTAGIRTSNESQGDRIDCTSSHLTAFSKTVLVAPTFIDPLDVALFATFFDNPVVVTVVLVLWMIYFFILHWARQMDKADLENVGIIYCSDNVATQTYTYIVSIVTGWWNQAGTTANVYVYLKGSVDNSPRKSLKTNVRNCFQSGFEDWFLLTTEHSLGDIKSVTIWHDNSGPSPHWFVNHVYVKDIQLDRSWTFVYNDWLAVDRGNLLMTTTTLQPTTEEELKLQRKYNFMTTSTQDLRDGHIWLSIFSKSASNTFTRVQRLTCCLTLLLTTMLTNLMFYGIPTGHPEDQLVSGGFSISLSQIVIGIESGLIMFPVNLLIVQLFTKLKQKPKKEENTPVSMECYLEAIFGTTWQNIKMVNDFQLQYHTKTDDTEVVKPLIRPDEDTILEAVSTEMEKKKDGKIFPWWVVYIAWTVAITTCLTSSYFVALYGLKYGYNRSLEWLVSFFTGFFQSVFVQQPVKVLGIAFVLTLIFKKTVKVDNRVPEKKQDLDENYLHSVCIQPPETHQLVMEPLPKRLLDRIKERFRLEWLMNATIKDLFLHIVYISVVLTMVHGHRNVTQAFPNTVTVRSLFVTPSDGFQLEEVTSAEEFFDYLQETVVPVMTGITADHEYATLGCNHYLVGPYRLRQNRIKREVCTALQNGLPNTCKEAYWIGGEDSGNYNKSWSQHLSDDNEFVEKDHWIHRSSWDLQTLPYPGTHATYSGGGYVLEMPTDVTLHSAIFNSLSSDGWIDGHTRAVFLEFTLYNPNVDLFTVVVFLFEFINVGRVFPMNHEFTSSLYHYSTDYQIASAVCEVLFVCFSIFIVYVEVKKLRHVGKSKYFSDFWTYVELIQLALSISLLGLFIKRFLTVEDVLQSFKDSQGKRFVSFYPAIFWDFVFGYISAALIALVTLKTVKYLRYNTRMLIVTKTLGIIRPVLICYMFLFSVTTIAFSHIGYLMFGFYMEDYKSFGDSWVAIILILLGIGDFVGMMEAFRFIGPLFIVAVVVLCQYVLMVMMTTILNIGRLEAKHELRKKKSKIALVKYIIGKVKLALNIK